MRSRLQLLGPPDDTEEGLPLLVGIDEDADVPVGGAIGLSVQEPHISGRTERRIEGASSHVIAEDELRERLEHGQLHRLPFACAPALQERGEDRVDGIHAHDAIRHVDRHERRLAGLAAEERWKSADALDEIVVGRLACIRARAPIAEKAHVDDARIRAADVGRTDPQPLHRGESHVVHEDVRLLADAEQSAAPALLLHVEDHRTLVAAHLQMQMAHPRTLHRSGAAHDVAVGRLDLDDVGAVVGEDLRRVRTHDDGRQIDDAYPREWSVLRVHVSFGRP